MQSIPCCSTATRYSCCRPEHHGEYRGSPSQTKLVITQGRASMQVRQACPEASCRSGLYLTLPGGAESASSNSWDAH